MVYVKSLALTQNTTYRITVFLLALAAFSLLLVPVYAEADTPGAEQDHSSEVGTNDPVTTAVSFSVTPSSGRSSLTFSASSNRGDARRDVTSLEIREELHTYVSWGDGRRSRVYCSVREGTRNVCVNPVTIGHKYENPGTYEVRLICRKQEGLQVGAPVGSCDREVYASTTVVVRPSIGLPSLTGDVNFSSLKYYVSPRVTDYSAVAGDHVVLAFKTKQSVKTPEVTIAGREARVRSRSQSDKLWSASVRMREGDTVGAIPFSINLEKLDGTVLSPVTDVTSGRRVYFNTASTTFGERVPPAQRIATSSPAPGETTLPISGSASTTTGGTPTLSSVSFYVNPNTTDTTAVTGDTVVLAFKSSHSLKTPTITIAGRSAIPRMRSGSDKLWAASMKMLGTQTLSPIPFSILASTLDNVNLGEVTHATTRKYVTFSTSTASTGTSTGSVLGVSTRAAPLQQMAAALHALKQLLGLLK